MNATYSISDLAKHTGVKPHTLRMWEKRYGLGSSIRDEHNVRCYSEEDVQKITKISRLNHEGHRISMLASLEDFELDRLYQDTFECLSGRCVVLDQLIDAIRQAQEFHIYDILQERLDRLGIRSFATRIWEPMQERLGFLILSGGMHRVHLSLFDQVVERLLDAQNIRLMESIDVCHGSVLSINSCGSSTSLFHQIAKHTLIKSGLDVTSLTMCHSDWASLETICENRNFHHIFIHYQQSGFDDLPIYDHIVKWLPANVRVILYGSINSQVSVPECWRVMTFDQVLHFIENEMVDIATYRAEQPEYH